jgi:hypothetical protein
MHTRARACVRVCVRARVRACVCVDARLPPPLAREHVLLVPAAEPVFRLSVPGSDL